MAASCLLALVIGKLSNTIMSLALDHIVIAVADLDRAVVDYAGLGFTVIRGGDHANGVTHNALVVFEDGSYLELIAWKRPDPGNRWSDLYQRAGEGFLDYALLPDDIEAVVAAAHRRGLDLGAPVGGGRDRPDGERLVWRTARSPRPDVPFLCADVTPRRLRVPEGDVRRHANGVVGVAGIAVAVADLEASLARNAALLGQAAAPVETMPLGGAQARAALLRLGSATLVTLASPTSVGGALAAALSSRGEGPFAVTFQGHEAVELDPSLSHGARFSIAA